jgi:hypothetical protein
MTEEEMTKGRKTETSAGELKAQRLHKESAERDIS